MDFDLKRPCSNCPFRTDVAGYLRRDRAGEIARSLTVEGRTFACHKTVEHAPGADEEFEPTGEEKHCAGALLMLDHAGAQLPQLARIAGRLGVFDLDRMDHDAPVFGSISEFVRHHGEDPDPDEDEAPCCAMAEFGCDRNEIWAEEGQERVIPKGKQDTRRLTVATVPPGGVVNDGTVAVTIAGRTFVPEARVTQLEEALNDVGAHIATGGPGSETDRTVILQTIEQALSRGVSCACGAGCDDGVCDAQEQGGDDALGLPDEEGEPDDPSVTRRVYGPSYRD